MEQTYFIQSQLKSIEYQLSSAKTTKEIGGVLGISADTLSKVNDSMDIQSLLQITKEFAKASDKVEMKSEMMNDAMEMASDDKLDADADKFYQQILEDQALEINAEGVAVPKSKLKDHEEEEKEGVDDL